MPENLGAGLDVVNDTNTKLFVIQQTVPANGGTTRLSFSDCNDSDLVASTKDGSVVAELTERWCPGQTWTISAPGKATLSDE